MRKHFIFGMVLVACLLGPAGLRAQQNIPANFKRYEQSGFQEKIYLHTDKSAYSVGETIWFRAYRVDAMFHSPKFYSGLLYVNFYDSRDSLIRRMQIVRTDSCFQGSLKLPATLPQGKYTLVAYSNWMQNFDDAFYFRKEVFVHNPIELKVRKRADFKRDGVGNIKVNFRFADESDRPLTGLSVNVVLYQGKNKVKEYPDRPADKEGRLGISFPESLKVTAIETEFAEAAPFFYKHLFVVPAPEEDFDVQFMPEGGHWLGNTMQRIAFKAVASDGKGVNVTGTVVDAAGRTVAIVGTSHAGMGSFSMEAKPGEKYSAVWKTADGKEKKVGLPEVEAEGIMLQARVNGNSFRCAVTATPGFVFPADLFLVLQCRGKVLATAPVKKNMLTELPLLRLPSGILHCFLATAGGTVYSERLVFIDKNDRPELKVKGIKENYAPRESVNLELQLSANDSLSALAELSVAVTDKQKTIRDSLENNLMSELLLCSDIKGKIENPYYYFDTRINREVRNRNVDLLMMTQVWKRFDVSEICQGKIPEFPYYLELQQSISGKIKNFWGKQASGGTVALTASGIGLYRLITADEDGDFLIDNISFPENTTFVIQGFAGKKSKLVEVVIDKEVFRPLSASSYRLANERKEGTPEEEFFNALKMDYYYDQGVKVYVLDEAVVEANRKDAGNSVERLYEEVADKHITGEEMEAQGFHNVWDWLSTVPGVTADEGAGKISIRGGGNPVILVDDIAYTMEEFDRIPITEIKSIGVVNNIGDMAILGGDDGGAGAIVIKLKDGFSLNNAPKENLGFFRFTPLGHHVPDKFYEPKYETAEECSDPAVDERITVYWNPCVVTDKNGKATVSFYTADLPSTYSVIVEGITLGGAPIFKQFDINRK